MAAPATFAAAHRGMRAVLIDLAIEARKVDPGSMRAIDTLVARVEETLDVLESRLDDEERRILPPLRAAAPDLAACLAADHRGLEALHVEVGRAAVALAIAPPPERAEAALRLCRMLERLTATHLAHMEREEGEGDPALSTPPVG